MSNRPTLQPRIACVQNGDYAAAVESMRAGGAETYQGQFASVESFDRLVGDGPSLVLTIAPGPGRVVRGNDRTIVTFTRGRLPGLAARLGSRVLPGRAKEWLLARHMIGELRRFRPTHLLLRVADVVGTNVLAWAVRNHIPTAVVVAATFDPARTLDRRFCTLANAANVAFVANHLRVATRSLIACGLRPDKAIEYDVPGRRSPDDHAERTRAATRDVLYVGVLSEDKGAGDVLAAERLLRARGRPIALTACGGGPLADQFRAAGHVTYLGRVPRERVVALTRAADVAVVPTRTTFAEGLPLTLLEALAQRTPVVASAHPVFTTYFREGQGLTFFAPGDPASLADAIDRLLDDPPRYAAISRASADAWHAVRADRLLDELIASLGEAWRSE